MILLQEWGYYGLFFGSFLASTVVPFSSEFLLTGVLLTGGNPWICFALATSGNWLGSVSSYWLGFFGKWEFIEKLLRVKREKLEKQKSRIEKWGSIIALVCWLPFIGDIFAIGLGFYHINFGKSALFMLIGKALRFIFVILIWFFLSERFN